MDKRDYLLDRLYELADLPDRNDSTQVNWLSNEIQRYVKLYKMLNKLVPIDELERLIDRLEESQLLAIEAK